MDSQSSASIRNTGHRGAGSLEPHNTLVAFQRAITLNIDGVELDVIRTKDNHLAEIHDDDLSKNTNGSGSISESTIEEVQQWDAGNGEKVPTLDDVLKLLKPTNIRIHIELKGPNTELLALECVRTHQMETRVIYSCFQHERLVNIKQLDPSVEVALLYKEPSRTFIQECKDIGGVGVDLHWKSITSEMVFNAHSNGIKVTAWFSGVDIDTLEQLRTLVSLGIDNLITNRPDLLKELL